MTALDERNLIGEIHCLNCGRVLGEIVRNPMTGGQRIRPAANQRTILVTIEQGRLLRCNRCKGRAFVEPVLPNTPASTAEAGSSVDPLIGAA